MVNDVDAKLGELSGLSVSSVECDATGGFRIHFGGSYVLAVFPASEKEMEWMLRWKSDGYMALMNGKITDSLPGVAVF